jgi:hypothetical protein
MGGIAVSAQVAAERAGDDGEDDVVHGPAGTVLDPLQLVEVGAHGGEAPVGPDLDVERRGGSAEARARERARGLEPVDHGVRDLARGAQERLRSAGDLRRRRCALDQDLAEHLGVRRFGARRPGRGLRQRLGIRAGVVEDRGYVNPRDTVDEAVVALAHDREPPALDPVDQPQLPERLRAIQALGEDPRGERSQLLLGARLRQGGVAEVVGEVELRVVDPAGATLGERDEAQLLAEPGHQVKPRRDVVAELVVAGRRTLEQRRRGDVHVRRPALQVQERGVEARQPVVAHALIFSGIPPL